jgi:hypothetical protein
MLITSKVRASITTLGRVGLFIGGAFIAANLVLSTIFFSVADYRFRNGSVRAPSKIYHHGLRAMADTDLLWGRTTWRLSTDSMGFRSSSKSLVSMKSDGRWRLLLIGDSFTEGIGLEYQDTFAGMLGAANPRIEVLNAAVTSYSPSIYLRKIRAILEAGLEFDEVWVFLDLSDVQDEATGYFFCDTPGDIAFGLCHAMEQKMPLAYQDDLPMASSRFKLYADLLWRRLLDRRWEDFFPLGKAIVNRSEQDMSVEFSKIVSDPRGGWTIFPNEAAFAPLGINGGIRRSIEKMTALHALLAERGIALNVAVYPWPVQMQYLSVPTDMHTDSWREFCANRCRRFINLYDDFFAYRDQLKDNSWYQALFIQGDDHYNRQGNKLIADRLTRVYAAGY